MNQRRVAITGAGLVTPLADSVPRFWAELCAGHSGVRTIERFDASAFRVHFGGEVKNFEPADILGVRDARRLDRFAQFALIAGRQAVADSGLDFSREDSQRCGVCLGSSVGGLTEFEQQHDRYRDSGPGRLSPFMIPRFMPNAASGALSIDFGLQGPNVTISTACASANQAIEHALRLIRLGQVDVVLTGGAEAALTPMALGGFCAARSLSTRNDDPPRASRPFDKDRDGFVLGEGAGVVVLEEMERARRRGATIYAELLGAGSSCDAYHIAAPHPEGRGAVRAMLLALEDAQLNPADVSYLNAHGTSTEAGDECETLAIKQVFGPHAHRLAISSTKSMTGHLLGAAGGVELIATALTIRDGIVHPTINYETPDPKCDLDYVPNVARPMRVDYAVSNSFGFGGHNCSLVVGAAK
ncbi:MAG TPA: beta-ketoacyl-ACP synthase II [Pirellulales bacterium]|jgi:3-oxoacyl-[acyl-carrier-protein] synthase II|nr:beta-ketoacyl-ACP synthase II [Pirellulales bacterium]